MSICSWRVFVYTKTSLLLRTTAIRGGNNAVGALRFAKASDVISYTDHTHVITDYRYDSFGRRIHTEERTKTGMRTIYDGLSFEVVKEAESFLGTRGITSSSTGEANLTNYTPHGKERRILTRPHKRCAPLPIPQRRAGCRKQSLQHQPRAILLRLGHTRKREVHHRRRWTGS